MTTEIAPSTDMAHRPGIVATLRTITPAHPRLFPILATLAGSRSDWLRPARRPRLPRAGLSLVGPLAVIASVIVSWYAFAGATASEGTTVALGLYVGAVSIVLMAWSFVLAIRLRWIEPLFGGLDRIYRVHRWAGTLATVAMLAHTSVEPEVEGGIRGAAASLADTAEGLAGVGEVMIYVLVALSMLRWFPYRWWRLTHKLFGIPFAFACFHFVTATKPYANASPWGWWFGAIMAAGLAAWVARVIGRDVVAPGRRHRIVDATTSGSTTELRIRPVGRALDHRAGQFAVLKTQGHGLAEPHPLTIASSPSDRELRFLVRDLGDWSGRLRSVGTDLVGTDVIVEGPYGQFRPIDPDASRQVWVAGGVGITPFLAAIADLDPAPAGRRPVLFYAVRSLDDAVALDELRVAEATGRLDLVVCSTELGSRFSPDLFRHHAGPDLTSAHVAACGPARLVASVEAAARSLGARHVEHEEFDFRQGFGPDLGAEIDTAIGDRLGRRGLARANHRR